MTAVSAISTNGNTILVRIPMIVRKRGGRKQVIAPEGAAWIGGRARLDKTLIKALARAHRWKRLLGQGEYGSLSELAQAETINVSYLSRVLRLTLLAPDIVETILDGKQGPQVKLAQLLEPFSVEWTEQRGCFSSTASGFPVSKLMRPN